MIAGIRLLALLAGLAGSGALLWFAAAPDETTISGYVAEVAAVGGAGAALGSALVLAARMGTVIATPRAGAVAGAVLAIVLALLAGLWALAAHAPGGELAADIRRWSADVGILGLVDDLRPMTVAFGLGALAATLLWLLVSDRHASPSHAERSRPEHESGVDKTVEAPARRAA